MSQTTVNLGPVDLKANWAFGGFFNTLNTQSTPTLSRGQISNTAISFNNNNLAHSCGAVGVLNLQVKLELDLLTPVKQLADALQKGIKDGKKSVANVVRGEMGKIIQGLQTALKAINLALGSADATGLITLSISSAKDLARKLNDFLSFAAEMTYNVGLAIGVVQGVQELIAWIEKLPAEMQRIVQSCLTNFKNSIQQTVNNINAVPSKIESTIKSQYNTTLNTLNTSINSVKSSLNNATTGQDSVITSILNGDASSGTLDGLKTMLATPDSKTLLANATKTTLVRP